MHHEPLIQADRARITIGGATALDTLSLVTSGDRAVLAGDVSALFAAIVGVRGASGASMDEAPPEIAIVSGSLLIAGRDVARGDHVGLIGAAPFEPPMPEGWTAERFVGWSAELAGAKARHATDLARAALDRVGLGTSHKRVIGALARAERRALALAQAIASSPEVLVAEAPLAGLDGAAAEFVGSALSRALEGRRGIVSVKKLSPSAAEGAFARSASHLTIVSEGVVSAAGAPGDVLSGMTLYTITARGDEGALRAALVARGMSLYGGPDRYSVSVPEGAKARDVVLAAKEAGALVTEIVPVVG